MQKDIDEKLLNKLIKLYTLSKQGVGGEAINADNLLNKLLEKHDIDISKIADSEVKKYAINYYSAFEKQLIYQVAYKVLEDQNFYSAVNSRYRTVILKLTHYQYAEIKLQFDAYKFSFKNQLKDFQSAFIQANNIFHISDKYVEDEDPRELTLKEKQALFRVSQMMAGIEKTVINRNQIEG
jgi:hypothetical protein